MLNVDDCSLAAGEFLTLCRGHQHFVYVLNLEPGPSPDQVQVQADRAVSLFLKCYRA